MTLEKRVAYWVDAGMTDYGELYSLQEKLAYLKKTGGAPDIIITSQHYAAVNFGSDVNNNVFSDTFLQEVIRLRGERYTPEDVTSVLAERGFTFSKTSRGGGATVLFPGQLMFYPVVDTKPITGRSLGVAEYKKIVYEVMFSSLQKLGVEELKVGSDQRYATRRDRRDVWVQRDGKSLKMGSKGLRLSGNIAFQGFALYIDNGCVEPFKLVNACGYDPKEVSVTSVEEVVGSSINHATVHKIVREQIKERFGYERIEDMSLEQLQLIINKPKEEVTQCQE
tara:strand:+ start:2392 stop:3231 length:840 start_codon:yes stop_codon:yes gene_type:complete